MQKKKRKQAKRVRSWEDWALIGIVSVLSLMVVCALLISFINDPVRNARKELKRIANDYYITFLYPRLLGSLDADPEKVLQKYAENGVATTYLRQLLHYSNDKQIASAPLFKRVGCDTNITNVRYFPTAPYGPRDYTVRYIYNCKNTELDE